MTRALDETLVHKTKRAPRESTLTDNECVALNLFWRKNVRVPVLAKAFRVSKNTIYYRALTGNANSYPTSRYSNKARDTNELINKMGVAKAWDRYVTDAMVDAVEAELATEAKKQEAEHRANGE